MLEIRKVIRIDLLGESQRRIDNIPGGVDQEVLCDGAGTGILGVETGNGRGRLAIHVLLPVDAALGEGGALEQGQVGGLFGGEAVVQDEARADVAVGDDGEEFGGVGVDVGGVQSAGAKEDGGGGDAEAGQEGKVGAAGEVDLAAHGLGLVGRDRVGFGVEVEFQVEVGVRLGDFGGDFLEARVAVVFGEEFGDRAGGGLGVGDRARVAEEACGGGDGGRGGPSIIHRGAGLVAASSGGGAHGIGAGGAGGIAGLIGSAAIGGSDVGGVWGASQRDGGGGGGEGSDEERCRMHFLLIVDWLVGRVSCKD